MEYIPDNDKHLDPPDIPEYAECAWCGERFHADDLDDFDHCPACAEILYKDGDA
jgi:Zn finger protein HypA/HybF involved in hydrogenase expression